jgi:hypothetical protein
MKGKTTIKKETKILTPENKEIKPVVVKPYSAKRKKIYKGKVAPTGYLYLQLTIRHPDGKLVAVKLIEGGKGLKYEQLIVTEMYLDLKTKYFPDPENKKNK